MFAFLGSLRIMLPGTSGLMAILLFLGVSFPAQAQSSPTIMIAGVQTANKDHVAAKLYAAVVNRISRRINESGFEAIASNNEAIGNAADNDAAIMQEAVSIADRQVKLVAIIQVLANTTIESDGTRIQIEIKGRIRDVASGKLVDTFSANSPDDLIAPYDCNIRCVIQTLIQNATMLADDVGSSVAARLMRN